MNNDITNFLKKQRAITMLQHLLPSMLPTLERYDHRLVLYFQGLATHSSIDPDDPNDFHNFYELLGGIRFLRLLRQYTPDYAKVQQAIKLREGIWEKRGNRWHHLRGGIKQDGSNGPTYYRWEPFQVFILASVFGLRENVNTHMPAGSRDLLPTEWEQDGTIWDSRRLCTDFTFFGARKNDKTGLSAFMQLEFFLLEDANAEVYCCANSGDQAKLLFERTRDMIKQLDPSGQRIRNTATVCDWLPTYHNVHNSIIKPLTAGPKSKDGLKASLASVDEYGSAAYTKGKSDMQKLVGVVQSSMATRREPLTFTTTTAGRITSGPFIDKLANLHTLLELELTSPDPSPTDKTSCLCLEPDQWQRDEETMLTSHALRRKVCPMLGLVVQHSYYDNAVADIRKGLGDLDEYITKNMNVYKSETQQEWITPARVRELQLPVTILDCTAALGYLIFTGMDFSLGDDLHASTYLAMRQIEQGQTEFFADLDAWMTEHAMQQSPMRTVFQKWADEGWLHILPGETMQPEIPVSRIAEIAEHNDYNMAYFLYDPFKATAPINALKAYIADLGAKPDDCVLPCRQNYATFNPLVLEIDYMVKNNPPLIHFSQNPLWSWQAGNMVLDVSTDGMENKKPVKRGNRQDKIDNWICLLMAERGYDIYMDKLSAQAQQ